MKYKRPIYQEPGLVKKQQSNLFNTQTTQTTDTSDEEKVNIFKEKLAKDREERLTQRPDTFTINPLQNFDFSSDVDDFGNPVERDSSTTNFLDSLWNSKNTEEKNKIWKLINTDVSDFLTLPETYEEGGSPTARRKRDRLPEPEPFDKATFWSVSGDIGKYALNQVVTPLETIVGRDFYDPKYSNTKFGSQADDVDAITSGVTRGATNVITDLPVLKQTKGTIQGGVNKIDPTGKLNMYQGRSGLEDWGKEDWQNLGQQTGFGNVMSSFKQGETQAQSNLGVYPGMSGQTPTMQSGTTIPPFAQNFDFSSMFPQGTAQGAGQPWWLQFMQQGQQPAAPKRGGGVIKAPKKEYQNTGTVTPPYQFNWGSQTGGAATGSNPSWDQDGNGIPDSLQKQNFNVNQPVTQQPVTQQPAMNIPGMIDPSGKLGSTMSNIAGDAGYIYGKAMADSPQMIAQKNKAIEQLQMGDATDARTVHYGSERNIIDDPYAHQKGLSDKMRLAEFQKSKAEKIGDALAATGEVVGSYAPGLPGQFGQTRVGQGISSTTMGMGQMFNPPKMAAHGMLVRREEDYNKRENQIKKLLWEE